MSYGRVVEVLIGYQTAYLADVSFVSMDPPPTFTDIYVLFHSDGHVITNWFQNRRSRDAANKHAAVHPDTVVETVNKGATSIPNGASTERKCAPTSLSAPVVTKPQPVAASRLTQPPPSMHMQSHFLVPLYPRNALSNDDGRDVAGLGPRFAGAPSLLPHQAGPTMHVSFLDDFSTGPTQQQRWGMQVELNQSDPNLPNLLGTGMLHGSKKGVKSITTEGVVFPVIPRHLASVQPLEMLGPVPSPGLPPYRPIPTLSYPPVAEHPDFTHVLPAQSPTPVLPSAVPETPVERPSLSIPSTNPPLSVSTTRAEAPILRTPVLPTRHRNRKRLSRTMSLEYYAGMMEKNRSPRKKTTSAPDASPEKAHLIPVKSKEDAPIWASMVSSPPSPTSPVFRKVDIERLKPLVKSGRTKSLEFACALARVRSSDIKNTSSVLGDVGAKRKRLEDLLLEPRGRKVKKIRRTFSSGVRETHKETRGLRKVASIAAIPLFQAQTKQKEVGRPMCSTEIHESNTLLSGSSFISNATTLALSDDELCSPTINASPGSSVQIKVTDWSTNARDKENREPKMSVKELEKNAVQVLASMLGTRV